MSLTWLHNSRALVFVAEVEKVDLIELAVGLKAYESSSPGGFWWVSGLPWVMLMCLIVSYWLPCGLLHAAVLCALPRFMTAGSIMLNSIMCTWSTVALNLTIDSSVKIVHFRRNKASRGAWMELTGGRDYWVDLWIIATGVCDKANVMAGKEQGGVNMCATRASLLGWKADLSVVQSHSATSVGSGSRPNRRYLGTSPGHAALCLRHKMDPDPSVDLTRDPRNIVVIRTSAEMRHGVVYIAQIR